MHHQLKAETARLLGPGLCRTRAGPGIPVPLGATPSTLGRLAETPMEAAAPQRGPRVGSGCTGRGRGESVAAIVLRPRTCAAICRSATAFRSRCRMVPSSSKPNLPPWCVLRCNHSGRSYNRASQQPRLRAHRAEAVRCRGYLDQCGWSGVLGRLRVTFQCPIANRLPQRSAVRGADVV